MSLLYIILLYNIIMLYTSYTYLLLFFLFFVEKSIDLSHINVIFIPFDNFVIEIFS